MPETQGMTIKELAVALTERAKRQFPSLDVKGELATIQDETVYRITHHKAIDNEQSWLAIISFTSRWRSDKGEKEVRVNTLHQVVELYDKMVDQALYFGLFKLEDFDAVALAT